MALYGPYSGQLAKSTACIDCTVYIINKNIPKDIESNIIDEVDKSSCGDRSKLLNYFTVNKLKTLTENIGDF